MTRNRSASLRNKHTRLKLLVVPLGALSVIACTGQKSTPRTTTTAAPVAVSFDLTESTERLRDSLSLVEGQTDRVLVPLHLALEVRSSGKSHFRSVIKDGQEVTLDLPIGEVEAQALVLIEAKPANWRDSCALKPSPTPSTSSTGSTSSTLSTASPSPYPSGGSQDNNDKGGILYVAAVEQKINVTAETNDLSIRLGELKEVAWRRFAAQLPAALSTPSDPSKPPLLVYSDAIAQSPILNPCTGVPYSDRALGNIIEISVPHAQLTALAKSNFRPFSPAWNDTSTNQSKWIELDTAIFNVAAELQSQDPSRQTSTASSPTPVVSATPYPSPQPAATSNSTQQMTRFAIINPVNEGGAAFRLSLLGDAGDADGDGVSNADELRQNTNPLAKPVDFVVNVTIPSEGGRIRAALQQDSSFWNNYRETRCEIFVDTSALSATQKSDLDSYRNQLLASMPVSGIGYGPLIPSLNNTMSLSCGNQIEVLGVAGSVTITYSVFDRFGARAGIGRKVSTVALPALSSPSPTPGSVVSSSPSPGPLVSTSPSPSSTPPPNPPPIIQQTGDTAKSIGVGSPVSIILAKGSDPDTVRGQTLGYLISTPPANGSLTNVPTSAISGGSLTYTPNVSFVGTDSFAYQICDNAQTSLCTSPVVVTITVFAVNRAPTNISLTSTAIAENAGANAIVGFLSATDPDINDTFVFSIDPGFGDGSAFSIANTSLKMIANPNFEAKNLYTIRIKVQDQGGAGAVLTKDFSISITDVPEMPTITVTSPINTSEDTPANGVSVVLNDPDGPLSCTSSHLSFASSESSVLPQANISIGGTYPNCLLNLTPTANAHGSSTITLIVTDGTLSNQTQILFNVSPVNDAPTFANAGDASLAVAINQTGTIQLATASDADGDLLNYLITSSPSKGTLSTIPTNAANSANVDFTPTNGVTGSDSFSYKICDNASPQLCTSAVTVTIDIGGSNSAPTGISLGSTSVAENTATPFFTTTLSATDNDAGETFAFSLVAGTGDTDNSFFTITGNILSMNGPADYETKSNYSIRIQVRDQSGSGLAYSQAFSISVVDVNEAPSLNVTTVLTTNEDVPLLNIPVFLDDPEGALSCTSAILASSNDSILLPNSSIVKGGSYPNCTISLYPAANKFASTIISLQAFDGTLYSPTTDITFTVSAVNDAPILQGNGDFNKSTPQNMQVGINLATAFDAEGDAVTYFPITQPANGTISGLPTNASTGGTVTYSPNTNFNGLDVFRYKVCEDAAPTSCSSVREVNLAVGSATLPGWRQESYIKAANALANHYFGSALSISSETLAVGAYGENSNQSTITNGSTASSDASSPQSGAVYVYRRSGPNWAPEAYIKASNTESNDNLGWSVALSGDTLAVGAPLEDGNINVITNDTTATSDNSAPESGAVYIYQRSGNNWAQQAYIKASNAGSGDNFGISVSLSGDVLAVGSYYEDENGTTIINGNGIAPNNDGSTDVGAVYVYRRQGVTWSQEAYLKASNAATYDGFGTSVSLSGDTLAVGATGEDENSTVIVNGTTAPDSNGADAPGAVYVYRRTGEFWVQEAYIKAANADVQDGFGSRVSLSGDSLAVGAHMEDENSAAIINGTTAPNANGASSSGAVYVYRRTGTAWMQEAYLKAANATASDFFGYSVSLSGDTLAVGAYKEDKPGNIIVNGSAASTAAGPTDSGAVYVYRRNGTSWMRDAYVKAANAAPQDYFGYSLSLSGDTLAVGALLEDKTGNIIVNGSTAPTAAGPTNSGAVYVYRNNARLFNPVLRVTAQTSTSISFAWGNNLGPAGAQVIVAPASAGGSTPPPCQIGGSGGSLTLSPGATNYVYSGLTSGQRYGFRFCSTDGMGVSGGATIWFETTP